MRIKINNMKKDVELKMMCQMVSDCMHNDSDLRYVGRLLFIKGII